MKVSEKELTREIVQLRDKVIRLSSAPSQADAKCLELSRLNAKLATSEAWAKGLSVAAVNVIKYIDIIRVV